MTGGLLRATPWRALAALATAGAVLGGAGVALGGGTGTRCVQLALVLLGGAVACVLDEPAAAVVEACPAGRARTVAARALAALLPALSGSAVLVALSVTRDLTAGLAIALAGCLLLGLTAAALGRTWLDEPAEVVAPAVVLGLLVTMLAEPVGRWVELFPLGPSTRSDRTWCALLAGCALALAVVVPERRWRVR